MVSSIPAQNVFELGFSPLGTYIITWQRPTKDENGDANKNLKVWRTIDSATEADGSKAVVGQFVQKSQTGWNLQYTSDEKFCARTVSNEVQFYESGNLRSVWNRLREEGVAEFAMSPGKDHSVAVFVPERKVSIDFASVLMHTHTKYRVCLPLSRFTKSRNSNRPCRKRRFSRGTRSNSSGMISVPALLCLHRWMLTRAIGATMEKQICTF